MDKARDLKIQFSGLKEGIHTFHFELSEAFLKEMDYQELDKASFQHEVVLEKSSNMLVVDLTMEGKIECDCDRCTAALTLPVEGQDRFYVKFGDEPSDDDQIEVLDEGAHTIDLSERIYQLELLSIPFKKVHMDGECDPEVLSYLAEGEMEDYLEEEDSEPEIDPRWNALKDLNKNQ